MDRVIYVDIRKELDGREHALDCESEGLISSGRKLVRFCTELPQESSTGDRVHKQDTRGFFCAQDTATSVLKSPLCNSIVTSNVDVGCRSSEPYAFPAASYSQSFEVSKPRRRKEKYNYAKALLNSDRELNRLVRRIRSEIQQSELKDFAIEAERAASSGLEKFSVGRGLSFMHDASQNMLYPRPPSSASRLQQSTRRWVSANDSRINLSFLRDADDVIPKWAVVHDRVREHLSHENVSQPYLSFREEKQNVTGERTSIDFVQHKNQTEPVALCKRPEKLEVKDSWDAKDSGREVALDSAKPPSKLESTSGIENPPMWTSITSLDDQCIQRGVSWPLCGQECQNEMTPNSPGGGSVRESAESLVAGCLPAQSQSPPKSLPAATNKPSLNEFFYCPLNVGVSSDNTQGRRSEEIDEEMQGSLSLCHGFI